MQTKTILPRALSAFALLLLACDDDVGLTPDAGPGASVDAASPDADPDDAGSVDAGAPPFGGLVPNVAAGEHVFDLFGTPGHRFWVEVGDEQLARMNQRSGGGFVDIVQQALEQKQALALAAGQRLTIANAEAKDIIGPIFDGDIYTPGGAQSVTYADHVLVEDATTGGVADYGKVEVKLVGESTFRTWDFAHIPNLRFDSDELEAGKRIGGFEHFRLNNGLVGTIFREAMAHRVFAALGYPALRSTHAWLGSNVWGHDVWIPMTLIEVYKRRFCDDNLEAVGGVCLNMWEFPGDPASPEFVVPENGCQVRDCDDTALHRLHEDVAMAPQGKGFKKALASIVDWPRFHQFQCLSWIVSTGDDAIHGGNNNLIIERDDGKLVWAPYSVDISAGLENWFAYVPLVGGTRLSTGCQTDPDCWKDTVATCEGLIEKFDALDPEKMVDQLVETLTALGMMRAGDSERAAQLRAWYESRQTRLASELERYRVLPGADGLCPAGLELCADGGCGTLDQCMERRCQPYEKWCDDAASCYPEGAECPACSHPALPVYCPADAQCVDSDATCTSRCDQQFPGNVFCSDRKQCTPAWDCPGAGGEDDGGVSL